MVLHWLSGAEGAEVGELIARKKYGEAIEILRGRFALHPPSLKVRLQFADLLILAGRGKEAVPVLIGLTEELARAGLFGKAVALLKRVDKIEPGRPDVEEQLERLVRQEEAGAQDSSVEAASEADLVELQEVAEEPALPAPEIDLAEATLPMSALEREVLGQVEPAASPAPGTEAPVAAAAPPEPARKPPPATSVTGRIRGALRRFLASLSREAAAPREAPAEGAPAWSGPPALAEELASEVAEATRPMSAPHFEALAEAQPEAETEPEISQAEAEALLKGQAGQELAGDAAEAVSAQAFHDRVLDVIEEVLHQPLEEGEERFTVVHRAGRRPRFDEDAEVVDLPPVRTRGVRESAQQLVSHPLFRDLSEPERLAVVRGMRLRVSEPGDVVITEGERGDSIFTLTTGCAKVYVRNPSGRSYQVSELPEGSFFGEISSLSGRPRSATIVAAAHCELLELDKRTVDAIARTHPRVRETLESIYLQRASSPESAAIRTVPVDPGSRQRAIEVLEAYFGQSRWDPRMRLRLADLLVRSGKEDEAIPLLAGLADDLARAGFSDKAIAILKKVERIRRRHVGELPLAPLRAAKPAAPPAETDAGAVHSGRTGPIQEEHFGHWLAEVVRSAIVEQNPADNPTPVDVPRVVGPGYAGGLRANPLFEGFSEDELVEVIREVRLLGFDPGDVIITEGETGQSLFILAAGSVSVWMRNPAGHDVKVGELHEGSFFGEMAAVSGRPRTATVTAREPCELLELDGPAFTRLTQSHPRVREVIEEYYIARATSPERAALRSSGPPPRRP